MAALTSARSGGYNNAATWNPAQIPTGGDDPYIQATHTVTLDEHGFGGALSLDGTLRLVGPGWLTLVGGLTVGGGSGEFDGGTDGTLELRPSGNFVLNACGAFSVPYLRANGGNVYLQDVTTIGKLAVFRRTDLRKLFAGSLVLNGRGVMIHGAATSIDASAGNPLRAYGTTDGGGNSNVVFHLLRRSRAVRLFDRRAAGL